MNLLQKLKIRSRNNKSEYKQNVNDIKVIDFDNLKKVKNREVQERKEKINLNKLDLQVLQSEYQNEFTINQFKSARKSDNKDKNSFIILNIINYICVLASACLSALGLTMQGYIDIFNEDKKIMITSITMASIFLCLTLANNILVNNIPNFIYKFTQDKISKSKLISLICVCAIGFVFSCYSNKLFLIDYLEFNICLGFISCIYFDLAQVIISIIKYDRINQNYSDKYKGKFLKDTNTNQTKKEPKNENKKTFQNTTNKGTEEPQRLLIGFNSENQKTGQNTSNKAGRKIDKRTIENIKNKIDMLESGDRITNKKIDYAGSRNTLKRVCKEHLNNIKYEIDGNGNEIMRKM